MSRKNLIAGALILILGGAFLFMTADISGYHIPHDAEHLPHNTINPRPYLQIVLVVYLPLARRLGFFPKTAERILLPLSRRA